MQFHSHADSHVGYQPEIERFLEATNPEYVNLCLDTGHVAYYGGDCLELITQVPGPDRLRAPQAGQPARSSPRCWTTTCPSRRPSGWAR